MHAWEGGSLVTLHRLPHLLRKLRTNVWALVVPGVMAGIVATPQALGQGFEKYREHTEYDTHFRKYSKRFFGIGFDWHYFKAQGIAESNLNPQARSPVGAVGIMQLMPATFAEVSDKADDIAGTLEEPRWNIAAGIWYNKYQFDYWQKGRALDERLKFMYGSYNAGRVTLRKAQRHAINRGLDPRRWESMHEALPLVTGARSKETLTYVDRVFEIRDALR
jgi:membrane-bound lytic murein transglycosylase MltF